MPAITLGSSSTRARGRLAVLAALACGLIGGSAAAQGPPSRVELTLRDAIEQALRDNLEIRIERYSLDLSALRLGAARGAYDPLIGLSIGESSSSTPTTSVLQGRAVTAETAASRTFDQTVSQLLPSGGSLTASFSSARASTNNAFSFLDPLFSADLAIEVRQPLLRGLFANPVRRELQILNLDDEIGDAEFRQSVSEIVLRVQEQYWNLVYALAAHKARQESRDLAVGQRDQIGQKVQAGLLTPVALISASAEVAIREQEVLQAEVQIVTAQNGLKRLLAGDPTAPIWRAQLVPVDRPEHRTPPASLSETLQQALERRPEIDRLELQARQRQLDRDFASWETKPEVSLSGSFTSIGFAGDVFRPVFDPNGGITPTGRVPDPSNPGFGGYQKAWKQVLGHAFPSWGLRLDVQMPLRNRAARARLAQADVGRRQIEAQLKGVQQQIVVEVSNAYETVLLQRKMLDVARLARELSQEQVRGETARFDVGFTTPFEVLRYQRDLGEAQVRELRALLDYQIALATLQKAAGTSLNAHDLFLAKSPN